MVYVDESKVGISSEEKGIAEGDCKMTARTKS